MDRPTRLALAASAAFALVSYAYGTDASPASLQDRGSTPRTGVSGAPSALPAGAWPQSRSDLKADPSIRFGVLPNGMRYAVMRNATPPGQVSMRLNFDVGSLMERDDQQGLAHFLEHMAFNGSTNVPTRGAMVEDLERLGLAFGADTNAQHRLRSEPTYKFDSALKSDAADGRHLADGAARNRRQPAPDPGRDGQGARRHPLRGAPARCPQLPRVQGPDRSAARRSAAADARADRPRLGDPERQTRPAGRYLPQVLPPRARHPDHRRRHRSGRHRGQDQGPVLRLERPGRARRRSRPGAAEGAARRVRCCGRDRCADARPAARLDQPARPHSPTRKEKETGAR